MPLSSEIAYWETVASECVDGKNLISDNYRKRPHQLRRLLAHSWDNQKVLEIGVGNGMIAGMLQGTIQGHWEYIGTELSEKFRSSVQAMFQLPTVCADVRELPGSGYTRIIALDSLEHVRPEHRVDGYKRIAEVAADDALLFIHYSYGHSAHDKQFDHPFGLSDILSLTNNGFVLQTFERYVCKHPAGDIDYAFVVMQKGKAA